jgi:hypothetical protein
VPQRKTKKRKAQFIKRPKNDRSVAPEVTEAEQRADATPAHEATKVDGRVTDAKPIEDPAKAVDRPLAPWANAHPRLKVPFTVKFFEKQHLQFKVARKACRSSASISRMLRPPVCPTPIFVVPFTTLS